MIVHALTQKERPAAQDALSMYKSLLDVVADAQSLDELTVLDDVVLLDVGEKTTTTADEHEQATTGVGSPSGGTSCARSAP